MTELSCDVCGHDQIRAQILLEGAKLLVCARCMKMGKILHVFHDEEEASGDFTAPVLKPKSIGEDEIVEHWGSIIKGARQKAKLSLKELALKIREKENFIHAIENERLSPTIEVAKKLEKELNIKLIEKSSAQGGSSDVVQSKGFTEPTLADMVTKKKEK